jgi:competence protein ComEA
MYDRPMRRLVALLLALLIAVAACESGGSTHAPQTDVININQATVADLEKLPGIGEQRARSIIASRNARGGMFTTYDEILAIDGIGEQTLDRIRGYITLGPPNPKKRP